MDRKVGYIARMYPTFIFYGVISTVLKVIFKTAIASKLFVEFDLLETIVSATCIRLSCASMLKTFVPIRIIDTSYRSIYPVF